MVGEALLKAPDIPPAQFPDDFALVRLGEWDDVKGVAAIQFAFVCSCITILADIEARRARVQSQLKQANVSNPVQSTQNA